MTSSVLKTLYASGGDEIRVACLSFRCDAWNDDVHLCQGFENLYASLETGQGVLFSASDFAAQLAKKAADGQQSLLFAINPQASDALPRVDLAMESAAIVYVDYREFLASDLSAPARPVDTMTVVSYSYQGDQLSFTASFHDLVNTKWPRLRYTTKLTPGLKYYGS